MNAPSPSFLEELFTYNNSVNKALIEAMTQHADQVSEKCVKLFSHILNAHQIWNYRIDKKPNPFGVWQVHSLDQLQTIDTENHHHTLRILTTIGPDEITEYTFRGDVFRHPVRDLLFHALNHATYHRGQIATEFRQTGLEPLATDYILYKTRG
ncbi:damage-inducible protein DinB [Fulvivirgaceae bacterium PWU5]|uniref:Damage-inducible protein DinB n=1 Tax=Dawidia cretensis TaxID=2782350 RepID=A0AAP2GPJ2_9BACT|nr:DinB family protein [Dawidia cretensis]MBT1708269.1 damage-inducible protein DinB [Dawidia cretensis]